LEYLEEEDIAKALGDVVYRIETKTGKAGGYTYSYNVDYWTYDGKRYDDYNEAAAASLSKAISGIDLVLSPFDSAVD
jgi:hypothetical protein